MILWSLLVFQGFSFLQCWLCFAWSNYFVLGFFWLISPLRVMCLCNVKINGKYILVFWWEKFNYPHNTFFFFFFPVKNIMTTLAGVIVPLWWGFASSHLSPETTNCSQQFKVVLQLMVRETKQLQGLIQGLSAMVSWPGVGKSRGSRRDSQWVWWMELHTVAQNVCHGKMFEECI